MGIVACGAIQRAGFERRPSGGIECNSLNVSSSVYFQ